MVMSDVIKVGRKKYIEMLFAAQLKDQRNFMSGSLFGEVAFVNRTFKVDHYKWSWKLGKAVRV